MRRFWIFLGRERHLVPFLLSIARIAVVTAALLLMRDDLQIATIALLYLLPVGISAAIWGLWPGVAASLAAFFSLNYFFIPPYGTLMVHQSQDLVALVVFLVLTTSISQ